jgi:hypothetical protein
VDRRDVTHGRSDRLHRIVRAHEDLWHSTLAWPFQEIADLNCSFAPPGIAGPAADPSLGSWRMASPLGASLIVRRDNRYVDEFVLPARRLCIEEDRFVEQGSVENR